jgi:hypothetical protein
MVVVFVAVAGYLYYANSNDSKKPTQLKTDISRNQVILDKGVADKAAKDKEAAALAAQLASAKAALAKVNFRSSAESIEYDRIFYILADNAKLQLTNLTAATPVERKDGQNAYKVSTFTINVEGKTPDTIFNTAADSVAYLTANVTNILTFIDQIATTADFDTATIQTVNISEPKPMSDTEIKDKIKAIKEIIKGQLTEDEKKDLTDDQITALVESKYAALTKDDIPKLLQLAGFDKPSATVTVEIWTYKGA